MIRIAGIVRKSPSNVGVEESVEVQRTAIRKWCYSRFGTEVPWDIVWFVDRNVSGDDPNRPELRRLLDDVKSFDFAVAHVVDRYVRSWRGLLWFFSYFTTSEGMKPHLGCKLCFVDGCPSLYDEKDGIVGLSVVFFAMMCLMAWVELLNIRRRSDDGRARLTEEEWQSRYKGRKKGSKNRK